MTISEIEEKLESLRNEYRLGKRSRQGITLEARCLKVALRIKLKKEHGKTIKLV